MSSKTSKGPSTRRLGTGVPQDEHKYVQIQVFTAAFPSAAGESGRIIVERGLLW